MSRTVPGKIAGTKLRRTPGSRRAKQSGMVLITMGAASIAMMGALGMAIDIGRLYITKNEAQTYADAHALAAALQLNGKSTGIAAAESAVTDSTALFNFSDRDKWNFSTCSFLTSTAGCTSTAPTVDFSTTATGPWYADAAAITTAGVAFADIDTVLVKGSVSAQLFFIPAVMATKVFTQTVRVSAVAGQIPITSLAKGLSPFTAVGLNGNAQANFGLVVGNQYTIQWPQFNASMGGCPSNNGNGGGQQWENCFLREPCGGDLNAAGKAAMRSVVQNWGTDTNGYWGANSGAVIRDSIIGTYQIAPVSVGSNIDSNGLDLLSNGNKASSANYLDDRVNSDPVNWNASWTDSQGQTPAGANVGLADYNAYASNPARNGRRMIVAPVVLPQSGSQTIVGGYGQFWLISSQIASGSTSNFYQTLTGNEGFCAVYVGPFNLGSFDPGSNTSSSGASRVRLLE